MSNKGISARKLLEGSCREVGEIENGRKVELPEIASVEIASDADGAGYMFYKEASVLTIGKNVWIISVGMVSGDYQAGNYDSDIIAIKVLSETISPEEIVQEIEKRSFSQDALIIVRNTGILYVGDNYFRKSVRESLDGILSDFIIQNPKIDYESIDVSTLEYLVEEQAIYDPAFVGILSKILLKTLRSF